ncbi:MAG: helix-turn-helix domain-containing protein [Bryobacteraceae bacterium]
MTYEAYSPAPDLARYVDCYWSLRGASAATFDSVLPDGRSEITVHLGTPFERKLSDGRVEIQSPALAIGQMRSPVTLRPAGAWHIWGVRFHPDGAWMFTGICQSELTECIGALGTVWGSNATRWEERLRNASTRTERVCLTDHFLRERRGNRELDVRLRAAVKTLLAAPASSIDEVATRTNWSRRQMERVFDSRVGLEPKTFARLARFQSALRWRRKAAGCSWADVAARCGYYDQAHLIADFREFGGEAPRDLVQACETGSIGLTHFSKTVSAAGDRLAV